MYKDKNNKGVIHVSGRLDMSEFDGGDVTKEIKKNNPNLTQTEIKNIKAGKPLKSPENKGYRYPTLGQGEIEELKKVDGDVTEAIKKNNPNLTQTKIQNIKAGKPLKSPENKGYQYPTLGQEAIEKLKEPININDIHLKPVPKDEKKEEVLKKYIKAIQDAIKYYKDKDFTVIVDSKIEGEKIIINNIYIVPITNEEDKKFAYNKKLDPVIFLYQMALTGNKEKILNEKELHPVIFRVQKILNENKAKIPDEILRIPLFDKGELVYIEYIHKNKISTEELNKCCYLDPYLAYDIGEKKHNLNNKCSDYCALI